MLKNKPLLTSLLITLLFGCSEDSKDQASLSGQQSAAQQNIDKIKNFAENSAQSAKEMVTSANQSAAETMEEGSAIAAKTTDKITEQLSDSADTQQKLETGLAQKTKKIVDAGQGATAKLDNIDAGSINNQASTNIAAADSTAAVNAVEKLIKENPTASGMKSPNLQQSTEKLIAAALSASAGNSILKGISFQASSNTLEPTSIRILDALAENLKAHPGLQVKIAGYTDTSGSAEINEVLSLQRAKSVKQHLVSKGADSSAISVKGYGELNPIADNSTAKGRSANRRVELGLHK
jgi:outer membrane protein OmpA-like peptidoglycan-associated protein